ncbi:uncharacterized protein [Fopius arisanus]|uniref:Uncharacterized protein isoform X1 n=1 Tax=Fopius arisanus TaxID=64838 RepID=A0A9R1SZ93_9HYME|nr:PREDICTED: uncharacterized protein LOC105264499 isoform X1 [Fopius arisanus]XP_011299718.1 PREDICTED: uncharacterized protein LOC105264499 isoform X1 [Fopius arisanus]
MSDQESHKYRYRLVEFLGEFTDGKKIIEIVADGWVRKRETMKDLCDYRPKKDWPKLEQWLQEERPFQNSWNIYEIEILGRAATFEKAKKKLERLYKTRSDVETHSEVDSAYGLDITRKRAASMLKTSYSLEDIEEESIVSPKRSRKDADSLSDRTQAPSVLQSDIRSMHPVEATNNATNQMHPKTHCEDRLQQLRKQNQNDPVKMFFADYLDASLALLSYNYKGELRNLRRCHQLDMSNHTSELKQSMKAPMMPIGEKFVLVRDKLGMKIPLDTLEDFEKWEKLLDLDNAENVEDVTQRRAALMEVMTDETSSSNDFVKDTKTILPLFINKPVQLLYSGIGRAARGVAKKNFSKKMSYACMRDFLKAKYKKSEKEMMLITTTSNWLAAALDRDGGAAEGKRARNSA